MYVEIKKKIKEMTLAMKVLESDVKAELKEKVAINGYHLQKVSLVTYSLKEGVDLEIVKKSYPKTIIVKESVDNKLLFQIADKPLDFLDEKTTESLRVTKIKEKAEDLKF